MMCAAQRLILGACLLAGRSVSFHVPVASSVSGHARAMLGAQSKPNSLVRRRVHSGMVMQAGAMQETIEGRLNEALKPVHLEVINESHMHSGPAKESHFKVIVVTEEFEGKALLARHRMINALFTEELMGKTPSMHALSIQGKTPSQWEAEGHKVAPSPPCMGGSKADPSMRKIPPALGATRRGARSRGHEARHRLSRWQRSQGFGSVAAAAGLVACAAWLCFPGNAAAAGAKAGAAAGSGMQAGANATGYFATGGDVDRAFYRFALTLGNILGEREVASSPFAQVVVMFNTAWVTTSTAPISAAGVIGQPLGRAMIATALSHTTFSVIKFSMAMLAMSRLPTAPPAPDGSTRRRYGPPTARSRRKPGALRKPSLGRPQVPSLPKRARARGGLSAAAAGADSAKRVTIQVRRSAKSVPRVWLMVVTALGGPSVGAVVSSVTHRLGYIAMPAALSSLSRGSVLGALAAGSLCYGGAGTWLAARWAVFQGVFGALFAAVLSPSALMFVFLCNYYARAVRASRGGPGRGGGGGAGRAAAGGNVRKGEKGGKENVREKGEGGSNQKDKK